MRLPESPENRAALNRYVEWRWKRSKATTPDRSRGRGLWLKGIDAEEAGRYRRENVVIAGASTTPPDFMHLPAEMAALIDWYEAGGDVHPVERAAELHTRFAKIHPFIDGRPRWAPDPETCRRPIEVARGYQGALILLRFIGVDRTRSAKACQAAPETILSGISRLLNGPSAPLIPALNECAT